MSRWRRAECGENGFTLVELLVVLVILPILLGAVADALIVTADNASSTQNRISNSLDAQIAATYFVRDVQGASYVTTDSALYQAAAGTYGQLSPEVCGPATGAGQLLIAFFHPQLGSGSALDSAYWLDGSGASATIDRYSCTLEADYSSASPVKVVIASAPPTTTFGTGTALGLTVHKQIAPYAFQVAAAEGWQPAAAYSLVSVGASLSASPVNLDVATTSGFTMPGTITVDTGYGPQSVTCTGTGTDSANHNSADFTSCTVSAGTFKIGLGAAVTQSSMSGVQVSVSAPGSNYHYSLSASPRSGPAGATASGVGVPTLLALGSTGIDLTGNGSYNCSLAPNNDKVCVQGSILVDGGPISCGTNGMYASGTIASAGGTVDCSGTTVSSSPVIANPYSNILDCFQVTPSLQASFATDPPARPGSGNLVPGIYTSRLNGTLEPGVYVADGGVGAVTMAAPNRSDPYFSQNSTGTTDNSEGVLIFIPGPYGAYSDSGCQTLPSGVSPSGIQVSNNGEIEVPPLDVNQSTYWFSGSTNEADLWIWQDATNPTPILTNGTTLICSGQVYTSTGSVNPAFGSMCSKNSTTTPTVDDIYGLAYLPASIFENAGTDMFLSGRLIISGVSPQNGTPGLTLTGG